MMESLQDLASKAFATDGGGKQNAAIHPLNVADLSNASSNPLGNFLDNTFHPNGPFGKPEGYILDEPLNRPHEFHKNDVGYGHTSDTSAFEQIWNDVGITHRRSLHTRSIHPRFATSIHNQLESKINAFAPRGGRAQPLGDPEAFWSVTRPPVVNEGGIEADWAKEFQEAFGTSREGLNYHQSARDIKGENDLVAEFHHSLGDGHVSSPWLNYGDGIKVKDADEWINEFIDTRTEENLSAAYDEVTNSPYTQMSATVKKEEAIQLASYLREFKDPKVDHSEFLSFVQNLAEGKMQFKENKLTDVNGNEVEWENIYAATKQHPGAATTKDDFSDPWDVAYGTKFESSPLDSSYDTLETIWKEAKEHGELTEEEYETFTSAFKQTGMVTPFENAWNDMESGLKMFEEAWNNSGGAMGVETMGFAEENAYDSAESPLQLAKQLIEEGKLQEAILACEAEVKQNPESSEGWRLLGQIYADNEQDVNAIQFLKKGHEVDPYNLDSLLALGVSLLNELDAKDALLQLRTWIRNHEIYNHIPEVMDINTATFEDLVNLVRNLFEEAVRRRPGDADALIALGVISNISKNFEGAVFYFSEALRHCDRPVMASIWNKIGATLANFGCSEAALLAYGQALSLKPNYPRAWTNLGVAHANLGFMNKAITYYLTALSLNPKASHLWYYIRVAALNLGREDMVQMADRHDKETLQSQLSDHIINCREELPPASAPSREEIEATLSRLKEML